MNLEEVKNTLHDIAEMFFSGASIIWSEQTATRPPVPYITLKLGNIHRSAFPIITDEGCRYYECKTTLTVNLYTKGVKAVPQPGCTSNYINTATSDMTDFTLFVDSDSITDMLAGLGMDVSLLPPVRDASELQNDSQFRYRAMAEFTVSYAEEANGAYGISDMQTVPNASGGGTKELQSVEIAEIDEVIISETTEGGNSDEEQ